MLRCVLGPNLDILIWIDCELRNGQAQNRVNFDFRLKFDLEDQGQSNPKTITRDLNQGVLHFWYKFGDSSLNGSLQWRHNGQDTVSNHQPHDCLLNCVFRRRSEKTSKLRVTGLCAGNSPGTGEFPAQMASYAENVCIWWRHHGDNPSRGQARGWHMDTRIRTHIDRRR